MNKAMKQAKCHDSTGGQQQKLVCRRDGAES